MSLAPWWSDGPDVTLFLGDCRAVLREMEADSVDAIVCDPPYDLTAGKKGGTGEASLNPNSPAGRSRIGTGGGFMGRNWDATGVAFDPATWAECLRVIKPGGHLLAFGAPRTWHRLVCAIEDAGFEIRDSIHWIYSQGMPKGLDVAKAIDKSAGAQREVIAEGRPLRRMIPGADQNRTGSWIKDDGREFVPELTAPATPEAAAWDGWNVALKPSHEPIVLARKPLAGTVIQNVLQHGTGALNIGACRVGDDGGARRSASDITGHQENNSVYGKGLDLPGKAPRVEGLGRWPGNVVFTHAESCEPVGTREVRSDSHHPSARGESGYAGGWGGQEGPAERKSGLEVVETWICAEGCPVAELDRQTGILTSGANPSRRGSDKFRDAYGEFAGQRDCVPQRGADSGGASRFFPVFRYEAKATTAERPRLPDGTGHETVKPLPLICWLVRLVSRPGALILDLFAGSGTTGEACLIEGRRCVLVEFEERSAELIKVRLSKPIQPGMFDLEAS